MANRDWSRALQTLGMLMQTPANFQRIREQQNLQVEKTEFDRAKRAEWLRNVAQKKATESDVTDLTTPRPDFLYKTSRESAQRGIAQQILGRIDPKTLAKSYLQPQKQVFTIPFEDKAFSFTDPNKYLTAMSKIKDLQKPDKDTYRITLKNGKIMNVNQATYIDYIQETGDFSPPKGKKDKPLTFAQMKTLAKANARLKYANEWQNTAPNSSDEFALIDKVASEMFGIKWENALTAGQGGRVPPFKSESPQIKLNPEVQKAKEARRSGRWTQEQYDDFIKQLGE